MTTIVYRDGVMVGDSAIFDRGTYCGQAEKVFRNDDGWLLGVAGRLGDLAAFQSWFLNGMKEGAPDIDEDETEALVVDPAGRMFWFGKSGRHVELSGSYATIGSGFSTAMGSLATGATAEQAAEVAADLNCLTRRPLKRVSLLLETSGD